MASSTFNFQDSYPQLPLSRRALERLGKWLATFTQTTVETHFYQKIDLNTDRANEKHAKTAFHEQMPHLSEKLLTALRLSQYHPAFHKIFGKVAVEQLVENSADKAFLYLGKYAQNWATWDLQRDKRFKSADNNTFAYHLTDTEKHALAQSIAYQNRALAVVGSGANLFGVVGMATDTLWLLLVALRSIFQLAHVYGVKLEGQQGIQIAYEILSKTDLSKLQEKQTLLAGAGVLDSLAHTSVAPNAKKPPINDNGADIIAIGELVLTTAKSLTKYANVALHSHYFPKILSTASVGIGASYNNLIINEVLHVAMLTFAPEPKLVNRASLEKIEHMT